MREPDVILEIRAPKLPSPYPGAPYKQRCISLYLEDDDALDAAVERIKAAGVTWMSASRLIRIALAAIDHKKVIADELSKSRPLDK